MVVLVILILAVLAFGLGAVIEGLFWLFVVAAALLAVAVWWGYRTLKGLGRRTSSRP